MRTEVPLKQQTESVFPNYNSTEAKEPISIKTDLSKKQLKT